MDLYQRQTSGRYVPFRMGVHATVRGVAGARQRQLLRRLDEESHERDDQLQRRFPAVQFLYRSN